MADNFYNQIDMYSYLASAMCKTCNKLHDEKDTCLELEFLEGVV